MRTIARPLSALLSDFRMQTPIAPSMPPHFPQRTNVGSDPMCRRTSPVPGPAMTSLHSSDRYLSDSRGVGRLCSTDNPGQAPAANSHCQARGKVTRSGLRVTGVTATRPRIRALFFHAFCLSSRTHTRVVMRPHLRCAREAAARGPGPGPVPGMGGPGGRGGG